MLEAGQNFAHFKIERKLGEGGMGAVYLAEDQKLRRKVAIKTLTGDMFDNAERLERFYREAKTAAQVSNAYVTAIYDIGKAPDAETGEETDYIVMEYVKGRSLADYIKDEKPELQRLVTLAEKIATGVAAAHKLNIVHRDIKPDNILIDENHDPKILDFGLAKPLDPILFSKAADSTESISQDLTRAGKIMGTVSYMSPEQVKGENVDTRSDIFSFGILLYRMATGEMPFASPTQVETMAKILESSFEPPRGKNENIPPELERVITKCLQKDREDRYQSSRDLVLDLRNLRRQYDSGVSDTISGITQSIPARKKSFTLQLRGGAVAVVILAIVAIWYFGSQSDGSGGQGGLQAQTNALAILGFENKTGENDLDWLETGLPEILLTDLSQASELQIISQQRILDCFEVDKKNSHTHEECIDAAKTLGATRLLSGAYFKLGDQIRIDARLEDVNTGTIILGEKVVGDDPFVLVDSLTKKIATSLNLQGDMQGVSVFASASPEAYKRYHLGMEKFWAGEHDAAVALFNQALAIDSSFALAYMRIGMSNVFNGKQTEGAKYFKLAQQYQDGLPVRDRSLLDAYVDTWVNQNFDHAFTKIEVLLGNYSNDAEIRTIYALFIDAFKRDTVASFAQMDTVLATYPTFPFTLSTYAQILATHNNYERAIEVTRKLVEVTPDAVASKRQLAGYYLASDREDEAMEMYRELHRAHPENAEVIENLIRFHLSHHEPAMARVYVEKLKATAPDDPYNLYDYYTYLTQVAYWEGKFLPPLEYGQRRIELAEATGDANLLFNAYNNMASVHLRLGHPDSVLHYGEIGDRKGSANQKLAYPVLAVSIDAGMQDKVRPMFKQAIDDFKSRVPKDFWSMVDALDGMFEGFATADTTAILTAYEDLLAQANANSSEDRFRCGELMVRFGWYDKAAVLFEDLVSGENETSNGWRHILSIYWLGVIADETGDKAEAIGRFENVLALWPKVDVEVKEMQDLRERLARLQS